MSELKTTPAWVAGYGEGYLYGAMAERESLCTLLRSQGVSETIVRTIESRPDLGGQYPPTPRPPGIWIREAE